MSVQFLICIYLSVNMITVSLRLDYVMLYILMQNIYAVFFLNKMWIFLDTKSVSDFNKIWGGKYFVV